MAQQDIDVADEAATQDESDAEVETEPFTGNILIQLFDENGVVKDERRAG